MYLLLAAVIVKTKLFEGLCSVIYSLFVVRHLVMAVCLSKLSDRQQHYYVIYVVQ